MGRRIVNAHGNTHAQCIPWAGTDSGFANSDEHTALGELLVELCLVELANIGQPLFAEVFAGLWTVIDHSADDLDAESTLDLGETGDGPGKRWSVFEVPHLL